MSRYRLYPTPTQAWALAEHCAHARYVWNLAVEQHAWWRPGRAAAPGNTEQSRQLTEARQAFSWLTRGSVIVQQQALRDFAQAMADFFAGARRRPTFRKAGKHEGFRIVAVTGEDVRHVSRKVGWVRVPKVGWVRFRWSRPVPAGVKSYRVTCDRAGRWHVAFAAIPEPIPGPGSGQVVGVDRGITVSAALSTGEMLAVPKLSPKRTERLLRLRRRLTRAGRGSKRRQRLKITIGRLRARETDARKNWVETVTTYLARRFDLIRIEDLNVPALIRSAKGTVEAPGRNVRQKAGLNRGILVNGWGKVVTRLEQKAPGRVEKINPVFTSQRCSACGHIAAENRKSQALFVCGACAFTANADVNAAINIAAGRAVTARGALQPPGGATNREPQPIAS